MRYVGIDLAAEAKRTGIAVVDESRAGCVVESVCVGADDDALVEAILGADRVGVDVPLGWPETFVEFIAAQAEGALRAPESTGRDWRRSLTMRCTDLEVHRRTGLVPLCVAADRIAHAAIRWAGIEARLKDAGVNAARDGSGVICEVYPAAALKRWSMPFRGYKGRDNAQTRHELVMTVSDAFRSLGWTDHKEMCSRDDNALDAVLSALIARQVANGACEGPPSELREKVRTEGWIWLPDPAARL